MKFKAPRRVQLIIVFLLNERDEIVVTHTNDCALEARPERKLLKKNSIFVDR